MDTYMHSIISYADVTIGAIFFNIPLSAKDLTNREIDVFLSASERRHQSVAARKEYINLLLMYLGELHRTIFIHEWYHILQAIAYPSEVDPLLWRPQM